MTSVVTGLTINRILPSSGFSFKGTWMGFTSPLPSHYGIDFVTHFGCHRTKIKAMKPRQRKFLTNTVCVYMFG